MRVKLYLPIILLITASSTCFSQVKFPTGVYMSVEEILKKNPSRSFSIDVYQRSNSGIILVGGNDFKLRSADKSIERKYIKKEVVAYSDGDDLYVNGYKFDCQLWYSKVHRSGKRHVQFKGALSHSKVNSTAAMDATRKDTNKGIFRTRRFIYEIDLETGSVEVIKEVYGITSNKE
ncbi:MAG: hypothetical protein HRT72_09435 [Flavobacteriales bacterium]|nr:hypothetical protein [Flavobacteriales bacterium]